MSNFVCGMVQMDLESPFPLGVISRFFGACIEGGSTMGSKPSTNKKGQDDHKGSDGQRPPARLLQTRSGMTYLDGGHGMVPSSFQQPQPVLKGSGSYGGHGTGGTGILV